MCCSLAEMEAADAGREPPLDTLKQLRHTCACMHAASSGVLIA